jgi:hypothetical protein
VEQAVPLIYTPRLRPGRLALLGRAVAFLIAALALAVLLVAFHLRPAHGGIGSHIQLGLEPCQFEQRTGVPCPTCGMTTSFAHLVRGQLPASLYVQPMGTVLAVLTAMTFWAGLYVAITGRPAYRLLRFVPLRYYLTPLLVLGVLAWIWKIWIHLADRDGWG